MIQLEELNELLEELHPIEQRAVLKHYFCPCIDPEDYTTLHMIPALLQHAVKNGWASDPQEAELLEIRPETAVEWMGRFNPTTSIAFQFCNDAIKELVEEGAFDPILGHATDYEGTIETILTVALKKRVEYVWAMLKDKFEIDS